MASNQEARRGFHVGEYAVYPAHGIGIVREIGHIRVGDHQTQHLVINFEELGMTLRLPVEKISSTGLRKLSSPQIMGKALDVLAQPAGDEKMAWPRGLRHYEAKLNSGDPIKIAELVRDLHCPESAIKTDKSQRSFYERGLQRLANELAAVEGTELQAATDKIAGLVVSAT